MDKDHKLFEELLVNFAIDYHETNNLKSATDVTDAAIVKLVLYLDAERLAVRCHTELKYKM